jgi:hypothetical protein
MYDKRNEEPQVGLAKLRNTPTEPLTLCQNCKCERYGKCNCKKKKGSEKVDNS